MINSSRGFTLIEMLVVIGIIGVLIISILIRAKRSGADTLALQQAAQGLASEIRAIQSYGAAGKLYNDPSLGANSSPCGYGIKRETSLLRNYDIYVGRKTGGATYCSDVAAKNYTPLGLPPAGDPLGDYIIQDNVALFNSTNLEFKNAFSDIFYESPLLRAFINNDESPTRLPEPITIQLTGTGTCKKNSCVTVCVYTTGRVDVVPGGTC